MYYLAATCLWMASIFLVPQSFGEKVPAFSDFQFKKMEFPLLDSFIDSADAYTERKLFMPLFQYHQLSMKQKLVFIERLLKGATHNQFSHILGIRYIGENESSKKVLEHLSSKLQGLRVLHRPGNVVYPQTLTLQLATLGYVQTKLGSTAKEKASILKEMQPVLQKLEKIRPLFAVYVKAVFGVEMEKPFEKLKELSEKNASAFEMTLVPLASSLGLGSLGGKKALEHLDSCASGKFKKHKEDSYPKWDVATSFRLYCLQALGKLGGDSAVKILTNTFAKRTTIDGKTAEYSELRQWIVFATATVVLHKLGKHDVIKSLEAKVLEADSNLVEPARLGIVAGLFRIGRGRKIAQAVALKAEKTPETLLTKRSLILDWLSYLPDRAAKEILWQSFNKTVELDKGESRRRRSGIPRELAEGLLRSDESRGVATLWKYARDRDVSVEHRKVALRAMALRHPKKYIPLIVAKFRKGNSAIDEFVRDLYVGENNETGILSSGGGPSGIYLANIKNPEEFRHPLPSRKDFVELIKEKREYKPCRNTCEILNGLKVWAKNKYLQDKDNERDPITHWKYALKSMGATFAAKAAPHCFRGYRIFNAIMLNWFDPKEDKIDENLAFNPGKFTAPDELVKNLIAFNKAFWKLDLNFAIGGWGVTFHVELIDMILHDGRLQEALGLHKDKEYLASLRSLQASNQKKLNLLVKGHKKHAREGEKGDRYNSYFHTHLLATAANVVKNVPDNATKQLVEYGEKNIWPYFPSNKKYTGSRKKGAFARRVPGYFFLYNRVRNAKNETFEKWTKGLTGALETYLEHFPEARLLYNDSPDGKSPHSGSQGFATYYRPVTNPKAQLSIWYLLHDPKMKSSRKKLIEMSYDLGGLMNALHDPDTLIEPQDLKRYPVSPFYVNALGGKAYAIACDIEKKFVKRPEVSEEKKREFLLKQRLMRLKRWQPK